MESKKDYIIQSLSNQLAEASLKIAEREAIITEQVEKINALEKEIGDLREEHIQNMNEDAK